MSDIVHQSVLRIGPPEDVRSYSGNYSGIPFTSRSWKLALQDALRPERAHLLERSSSDLEVRHPRSRESVKMAEQRRRKTSSGVVAICALRPASLLEILQKEVMFKSKHKLDLSLVSMDQRAGQHGGYDLVHYDDLAYVASAHQECSSGPSLPLSSDSDLTLAFDLFLLTAINLIQFSSHFQTYFSLRFRAWFRSDLDTDSDKNCNRFV
ncbi:hypothetical protein EVAR_98521_1 [Eumeta japonica]|uniref:Uncharacterized protein n=1 Tax=Eumeta variegata TaxID=151549 RepID=A0A4C1ZYH2_EUMVA|nr:hypothetical protein EVAR_98521_1 [Eumeta japonica]